MTITASLLLATPALAQHANHQGMNHGNMAGMNHSMPATAANPYGPAEMKMHQKMMGAVGPNASETWVRKMIEHHRGGVETSRIAIARATDPRVKQLEIGRESGGERVGQTDYDAGVAGTI